MTVSPLPLNNAISSPFRIQASTPDSAGDEQPLVIARYPPAQPVSDMNNWQLSFPDVTFHPPRRSARPIVWEGVCLAVCSDTASVGGASPFGVFCPAAYSSEGRIAGSVDPAFADV